MFVFPFLCFLVIHVCVCVLVVVMFFRFVTSGEIRKHVSFFEPFILGLANTTVDQVSTQKEDYLVDTIALHDVMEIMRPVFSDPSILKVFHGGDNDVLWLQRDFHIYVIMRTYEGD